MYALDCHQSMHAAVKMHIPNRSLFHISQRFPHYIVRLKNKQAATNEWIFLEFIFCLFSEQKISRALTFESLTRQKLKLRGFCECCGVFVDRHCRCYLLLVIERWTEGIKKKRETRRRICVKFLHREGEHAIIFGVVSGTSTINLVRHYNQ